eukprot:1326170-Pleurochrysis_carterae.AAC.2
MNTEIELADCSMSGSHPRASSGKHSSWEEGYKWITGKHLQYATYYCVLVEKIHNKCAMLGTDARQLRRSRTGGAMKAATARIVFAQSTREKCANEMGGNEEGTMGREEGTNNEEDRRRASE